MPWSISIGHSVVAGINLPDLSYQKMPRRIPGHFLCRSICSQPRVLSQDKKEEPTMVPLLPAYPGMASMIADLLCYILKTGRRV